MHQVLLQLMQVSGDVGIVLKNDVIEQVTGKGRFLELAPMQAGDTFSEKLPPVLRRLYLEIANQKQGRLEFHLPYKSHEVYFNLFLSSELNYRAILVRDVAAPLPYEQELQRVENRFRIVLQSAAQGILMVNIHGQIVLANHMVEKLFGFSNDELMHMSIETLVAPAYRDLHARHRSAFVSRPVAHQMANNQDVFGRHKDGHEFPIDVYLTSVEMYDGLNVIAFITDISEQRKLQNKIRRMEKLEAIGQLAGGIAHDFNNVLAGVIGLTELALRKLPEDSDAGSNLQMVIDKAQGAAQLVRQLLAFSRQQVLSPQSLKLNTIIRNNRKLLQRYLGEDIRLSLDLDDDLLPMRADPSALDQIITNLCINARDAMPDGGDLLIKTQNVNITTENISLDALTPQMEYIKWTVTDTGIGMRQEVQKHVFEPFFSTKEFGQGTGLGLATVYGLVEQHNGTIQFESQPGEGTSFNLYFPAQLREQTSSTEKEADNPDLNGRETILMIDDEKDVLLSAAETLRVSGYKVLTANNGVEGLAVFEEAQDQVDLVISDLVMPEMGGVELKMLIQKAKPEIKFLHISAYSDKLKAGRDYLQKPYLAKDLLKKVRQVLDS